MVRVTELITARTTTITVMRMPTASAAPGAAMRSLACASLLMGYHGTRATFRERYGGFLGRQGQAERDRVAVAERLALACAADFAAPDGHAVRQ